MNERQGHHIQSSERGDNTVYLLLVLSRMRFGLYGPVVGAFHEHIPLFRAPVLLEELKGHAWSLLHVESQLISAWDGEGRPFLAPFSTSPERDHSVLPKEAFFMLSVKVSQPSLRNVSIPKGTDFHPFPCQAAERCLAQWVSHHSFCSLAALTPCSLPNCLG